MMRLRFPEGPPSVSALIRAGERFLLVRRGGEQGLFPHAWTLPTATSHDDEPVMQTLERVLKEHLGGTDVAIVGSVQLRQPSPFGAERGPGQLYVCDGEATGLASKRSEWTGATWVRQAKMDEMLMFREARETISRALRHAAREAVA